jgi:DNA-binding transcriptional MerR regulator
MTAAYTREELAEITGISTDLIHKYRKLGLLPPGNGWGRWMTYDVRHVRRIRLIQKLHDPEVRTLAEIKSLFTNNPDEYAFQ